MDPSLWNHVPIPLVKRTKKVRFGLWDERELIKYSTCQITSIDMFDNNEPQFNSLFDLRMGTCDPGFLCYTCHEPVTRCVGHFGRLPLVRPVYWWHFMSVVIKLIQTVCRGCSHPLVSLTPRFTDKLLKMSAPVRMVRMLKLCASKRFCGHCGMEHPRFVRDNFQMYVKTGKKKEDKELYPIEHVYRTLDRMSDETVTLMGFDPKLSHPRNLICTVVPIAPPAIRPSMLHDASLRSEGDLTFGLLEIVKANKNLAVRIQDPNLAPEVKDAFYKLLQYHVTTMIDNRISGIPPAQQRSGRMLKGIRQKIKGKDGRIRGNLMGKRVDFSARTVIGPDPSLDLDELGVPEYVAVRQTIPETVMPWNLDRLRDAIRRGPSEWPGANVVEYGGFTAESLTPVKMKHLHYLTETQRHEMADELNIGDIVHRHLIHGDIVAFNRQPSLHKMSMMGHRVRVLPGHTFRIYASVCTPYNADFDGDEMNLFNPQSIMTQAETRRLMGVPYMIVSPQCNKPVIGCIMDTLVGSRKMTIDTARMSLQRAMNTVHALNEFDPRLTLWTHLDEWDKRGPPAWARDVDASDSLLGREVFSWFMPPYSMQKTAVSAREDPFCMELGIVKSGASGKPVLGALGGGLVHYTWRDVGPQATRRFLKNTQNVLRQFMSMHGLSVGIGDCHIDRAEIQDYISEQIQRARVDVGQILASGVGGGGGDDDVVATPLYWPIQRARRHLAQQASVIRVADQEASINNILNRCRDQSGSRASDELNESNNIKSMVAAQSKGSFINISQIAAVVGQQNVQGLDSDKISRIPFGLKDRTSCHFSKFDQSPAARGFVSSCYARGLNPSEFFFHAMSGREGLIDTAVKTSETGYIQRRLMKLMEDIIVHHDQTVRSSANLVVQFVYGGDGWDGAHIERVSLPLDRLRALLAQMRAVVAGESGVGAGLIQFLDHWLATCPAHLKTMDVFTPIPWNRLTLSMTSTSSAAAAPRKVSSIFYTSPSSSTLSSSDSSSSSSRLLSFVDVFDSHIAPFLRLCSVIPTADLHATVREMDDLAMRNMRLYAVASLCPLSFTRDDWTRLLDIAWRYVKRARVQAGEMVGPVAAQSIGEPSTQLTLNTFHYSGVASKTNVTRGVPRLKELITVSKTLKTPSLTIPLVLKPTASELAQLSHQLTSLPLGDLFIESSIHWDPEFAVDREDSTGGWAHVPPPDAKASPFLLRIVLDSTSMCHHKISMVHLINLIEWNSQLQPVYLQVSPEDSETMVLHLRYKVQPKTTIDMVTMRKTERYLYLLHSHGIERITRTFVRQTDQGPTIDTNGTNLRELLGAGETHSALIDLRRVISNDVNEVFQVLGIEAARTVLLNELRFVMDSNGNYINPRHLKILVDIMTNSGQLLAIDRHGIKKSDQSPFARASFEESADQLARAAVFAEEDTMQGVSSNILVGQTAPFGSSFQHEFELDLTMIQKK